MAASFFERVDLLAERDAKAGYTHIDLNTNTRYRISSDDTSLLRDIHSDCIESGVDIRFAEIAKDTSPLRIRFREEECNREGIERVVDLLAICARRMCSGYKDGDVDCCIFLDGAYIVAHFPFGFVSDTMYGIVVSNVESSLETDEISLPWSKAVVREQQHISEMYNSRYHKLVGCYRSFPDAVRSREVSVEEMCKTICGESKSPIHILLSLHTDGRGREGRLIIDETEYILPSPSVFSKAELDTRNDEFLGQEEEKNVDPGLIIPFIDHKRINDRSEWMRIGEAIYNYHRGMKKGCKEWVHYTNYLLEKFRAAGEREPDYLQCDIKEMVALKYHSFPTGRVDVRDVAWMAQVDNPQDYMKWHADWCKVAMMDAVSCIEEDVAEAFYRINWLSVVTEATGAASFDWYYFDKHRHMLIADKNAVYITNMFLSRFRRRVRQLKISVRKMGQEAQDEDDDEDRTEKSDNVCEMVSKLKTLENKLGGSFGDRIVRRAGRLFNNPDLQSLLDSNPELTCARTCVVVATRKEVHMRPGRPQDYITKQTGSSLRHMTWSTPSVVALIYWSIQTFRDSSTVRYWWMFLASLWRGGNPDKIFPVIWGYTGNNAKTAWVKTIQKAIGVFCIKGTTAIMTREETNPHSPSSMLVDFGNARLVLCEETEGGGRPIRSAFIKKATGSDTYYACRKFKEGVQITPHYVFGIVSNNIPELTENDDAMRIRLVVFVFDSIWKARHLCAETEAERFKEGVFVINKNFSDEIDAFGDSSLWIMYNFYADYVKEGLENIPEKMRVATDKYWNEKDKYYQFTSEKIDITENPRDEMTVTEVQDVFNAWHDTAYSGIRPAIRSKLIEELGRRWGDPVQGKWVGIREKIAEIRKEERRPVVFDNDVAYSPPPPPISY